MHMRSRSIGVVAVLLLGVVVRAVPMLLEFAHDRIGAGGDNTGL